MPRRWRCPFAAWHEQPIARSWCFPSLRCATRPLYPEERTCIEPKRDSPRQCRTRREQPHNRIPTRKGEPQVQAGMHPLPHGENRADDSWKGQTPPMAKGFRTTRKEKTCRDERLAPRPLYPRKLPRLSPTGASAKGQQRTSKRFLGLIRGAEKQQSFRHCRFQRNKQSEIGANGRHWSRQLGT